MRLYKLDPINISKNELLIKKQVLFFNRAVLPDIHKWGPSNLARVVPMDQWYIEKYEQKINFIELSRRADITPEIAYSFRHKLHWVSATQVLVPKLNNSQIDKLKNFLNWSVLCRFYHKIITDFIIKYIEKIDWEPVYQRGIIDSSGLEVILEKIKLNNEELLFELNWEKIIKIFYRNNSFLEKYWQYINDNHAFDKLFTSKRFTSPIAESIKVTVSLHVLLKYQRVSERFLREVVLDEMLAANDSIKELISINLCKQNISEDFIRFIYKKDPKLISFDVLLLTKSLSKKFIFDFIQYLNKDSFDKTTTLDRRFKRNILYILQLKYPHLYNDFVSRSYKFNTYFFKF